MNLYINLQQLGEGGSRNLQLLYIYNIVIIYYDVFMI